jgi:hypothetical protein
VTRVPVTGFSGESRSGPQTAPWDDAWATPFLDFRPSSNILIAADTPFLTILKTAKVLGSNAKMHENVTKLNDTEFEALSAAHGAARRFRCHPARLRADRRIAPSSFRSCGPLGSLRAAVTSVPTPHHHDLGVPPSSPFSRRASSSLGRRSQPQSSPGGHSTTHHASSPFGPCT